MEEIYKLLKLTNEEIITLEGTQDISIQAVRMRFTLEQLIRTLKQAQRHLEDFRHGEKSNPVIFDALRAEKK